jgi:pyruvate dehydrogenase E2 component (dihydrolipoamide acetyltransferase)
MAEIINMPRLSDTMTEGVVATWLKKVGDKIQTGDILAEIETDKATMEFESFYDGFLLHIGVHEGETAPVDTLLAILGDKDEDISKLINKASAPTEENTEPTAVPEDIKSSNASSLPKDVIVVTMPRLSDTMTDGTVATWLKKVGDKVTEGDILAEIETDKATMEFESFNAGTLLYIGVAAGETAPVDSILAILGPEGTDVSELANNYDSAKGKQEENAEKSIEEVKPNTAQPTATGAENFTNDGARIFASPLAKKIAEEKGINLRQVQGSGESGRITKQDVENFIPVAKEVAQASVSVEKTETANIAKVEKVNTAPFVPVGEKLTEEVKNSQMRKTIAKRLAESKFTAPHYYLTIEVTMDDAMTSRQVINSLPDTKVSFNDMVIKACAMALKKHPKVNTQWKDDVTVINHHVNIGVAVAVEDGLVVPVLNFTDQMSLSQIGSAVKDLAGRARNKKLQPAEMDGSTFTVSNLGMFGISEFTSIINQPNSAILSVGAIIEKPIVKNSQIVVGNTMTITLACDHRTVDGATGAQFLQTLRQFLENPVTMLA